METTQKALHQAQGEVIRVRCPQCKKLYSVHAAQIQTHEPRFDCISCQAPFAFVYPLPVGESLAHSFLVRNAIEQETAQQMNEVATQIAVASQLTDVAPKSVDATVPVPISARNKIKASEKANDRNSERNSERVSGEILFGGSPLLAELWRETVQAYSSEELHNKFIWSCYEAGCLPFASHKYARILHSNPEDEIAKKMRKRLIALANTKNKAERGAESWNLSRFRLPSVTSMIFVCGTLLLITGYMFSSLRNLAGVGASLLALTIGIKIFFGRN